MEDVIFRTLHVLFGILWIGLLYYFNFVQTEYIKNSTPEGKSDVIQKLVPNALWYFRWAAAFTFLTGLYLLHNLIEVLDGGVIVNGITIGIVLGATMGTLMFLNVWLIIWPNQKKVIAGAEDAADAGAKAGLASRTNTLFSIPMLWFMVFSAHGGSVGPWLPGTTVSLMSLWIGLAVIALIELNAIFGKMNPLIASVKAVIHSSLILAIGLAAMVYCL
tara:strand:+ start:2905 stop:3558 length:654 start_codon:yes stop_codon:yes gene_type:complete